MSKRIVTSTSHEYLEMCTTIRIFLEVSVEFLSDRRQSKKATPVVSARPIRDSRGVRAFRILL